MLDLLLIINYQMLQDNEGDDTTIEVSFGSAETFGTYSDGVI